MRFVALLVLISIPLIPAATESVVDLVVVSKSDETLQLLSNGTVVGSFHVKFGANPEGPKQKEGDERTPEGRYTLDYRLEDSEFYRAIHISYPNELDRQSAAQQGEDPGGAIMIHGQKNGFGWLSWVTQKFNWTDGCIAVTNDDMDEIWELVPTGTPIEIHK